MTDGASTAFCYLTDGRNSQDLREASYRSLTRFQNDIPVYVCTLADVYKNPRKWERLVCIRRTFKEILGGQVVPTDKMPGSAWSWFIFGKLVLPFVPELSRFDRIVFMDDDIEVLKPEFTRLPAVCPLRQDADLAACPDAGYLMGGTLPSLGAHASSFWSGAIPKSVPHFNAGVLVHRGGGSDGLYHRVRRAFARVTENPARFADWPEETLMTLWLHTQALPSATVYVPRAPEVGRAGVDPASPLAAQCLAVHYGGPRKRSEMCRKFVQRYMSRTAQEPTT